MIVECSQCRAVGRHGMVGEEASDHLLEPAPLLGNRFVHAPPQFLLDLPERCPHAIAPCCSFDKELPTAVAFADEGKPKKVEGLRFSEPAPSSSFCRKAAELDQAGLVRIERQREPLEPLAHIVPEAPGICLVLEADDNVISITHEDHVARGLAPSPALGPEVEHVMQVNVGEQR